MKRYAVKNGDRGLAVEAYGHPFKEVWLVERKNGKWYTVERDDDSKGFVVTDWSPLEDATVYRDLRLDSVWVEAEYVEAHVGMKVRWVYPDATLDIDLECEPDQLLTIHHFYVDDGNQCARATWDVQEAGKADDAWSHLVCFRCAKTGKPLRVPDGVVQGDAP